MRLVIVAEPTLTGHNNQLRVVVRLGPEQAARVLSRSVPGVRQEQNNAASIDYRSRVLCYELYVPA